MIGVLIVSGIVFYGMVYSGVSQLYVVGIAPVTTLEALRPKTAPARVTAKDFPKPTDHVGSGLGTPRRGRT